jgi:hypothetical protein
MSTTVRIICEVELTVDTWDSKATFERLANQAVREGKQILSSLTSESGKGIRLIAVKETKFVTHSIQWNEEQS